MAKSHTVEPKKTSTQDIIDALRDLIEQVKGLRKDWRNRK